jgi:hypothetical protein
MTQHKITVWLEINGEEKEATVEFDYSPGRPGRWYLNNGDPGYPDEPAEIEVTKVVTDRAELQSLFGVSEALVNKIEQACWDHIEHMRENEQADAWDHWKSLREVA